MKTIKQTINEFISDYPIEEKLAPREELLFLDIETTGFTARSSFLYLIGCSYFADELADHSVVCTGLFRGNADPYSLF